MPLRRVARLLLRVIVDLTAGETDAGEEAVVPFSEVPAEGARIRIGSILRWVIGYESSPNVTKNCVSQIVFSDAPKVIKVDL